jgi:molecular chaperone DnaJ
MTAQLRIPRLEGCETCKGSGAASGTQPETCQTCAGTLGSITIRLPSCQNVWCMSWCRSCNQDSVQGLQRCRTC